jgi:VIT1/CCC1 family predicted Fe2+/Mn2+ transporter
MLLSIVKKYNYVMTNHAEKVGIAGAALVLLPVIFYLESSSGAWMLSLPLAVAGLFLLALNWYWSR